MIHENENAVNGKLKSCEGNRSLDIYLREINRTPLLTREQEQALAKSIRGGDKNALDRLVKANLRFVVMVAKRYARNGLPLQDLINEGNVGLIKAAHRFDESRGVKFISYAIWWIRQAMLQALADHSSIVRFPINRYRTFHRIGKASRELDQELGRPPSALEIASRLHIPEAEVRNSMYRSRNYVSLDEPLTDDPDNGSWIDQLIDESTVPPDAQALESAMSDDIRETLDKLPERERIIFVLFFGFNGEGPMTLDAIGEKLNISGERVRQIKDRAIQRLRRTQLVNG
ncbi:MAG: RNA polymerase sigma factor RpoD/SigA [Candidatus Krumholzibacteriia bacterium]